MAGSNGAGGAAHAAWPASGDVVRSLDIAVRQARTPKTFFQGTHRTRTPRETLESNRRFMAVADITRLANVTGLDRIGLPVCVAVRPNSRSLATSQGKGQTVDAAMASALMESLELWHAERIDRPLRYASYRDLAERFEVIDVAQAPVRADAAYHPGRPIMWLEGLDLVCGRPCLVPYELVSMNFVRQPGYQPIFLESSNGLSSGNCFGEALVHGLCEVIERDAVALWELTPQAMRDDRQVALNAVPDRGLSDMLANLRDKGFLVAAWDITSDIGVPVFTCALLENPDSPHWRPLPAYFGHGCHLDPAVALSRAITEAIQSRLTAISGSRDDMFPSDYVRAGNRDEHLHIVRKILGSPPKWRFPAGTPPIGDYIEDDLETLLDLLAAAGADRVVAVDLTRAEIGVPVVKLVVTALEPYRTALYQPGARANRFLRKLAQ